MFFSGVILASLGLMIHWHAAAAGGALRAAHWLGLAFLIAGASYMLRTPRAFGKQKSGAIAALPKLLLLPYLGLTWTTWHLVRTLHRENPFDRLRPNVWIGRRLLAGDPTPAATVLLDLTCEFDEPAAIRERFDRYISFPILDRGTPPETEPVLELVRELIETNAVVYIHCAQGHGRTGTLAAAFLLVSTPNASVDDALASIRQARPGVRLAREQRAFVERVASSLAP